MPSADVRATGRRKTVILVPLTAAGSIFLEADRLVVTHSDFAFLQRRAFELEVTIDARQDDVVGLERMFRLPFYRSQP
jgi:hypothetical protein